MMMSFWNEWDFPHARVDTTNHTTGRVLREGKRDTDSQDIYFSMEMDEPRAGSTSTNFSSP